MRDELMRILSWAVLSTGIAGGGTAGTAGPAFTPVQTADYAIPGSLSNSWADFDRDGDLDLAVSIKTGEIRLYRNDRGTLTNIGAAMGLPVSGAEMRGLRSEEHTSELQSLMRISYAVFCLKKKKT